MWRDIAVWILVAVGVAGVGLMVAAFAIVSRAGGWQKAISEPIQQGRWPLQRRLLLLGSVCGIIFVGGALLLALSGNLPWQGP